MHTVPNRQVTRLSLSKASLTRIMRWHAVVFAVATSSLQSPLVASALFQLEDTTLDAITAEAGSQALASGGAFNAMTSPAPILVTAPLDVELLGSPVLVLGTSLNPNPSPLASRADSFNTLNANQQLAASAQAKASGEASRTSSSTSTQIVPSSSGLAGSAIAGTAAFAGPARVLAEPSDRSLTGTGTTTTGGTVGKVAANVATTAEALARGRLGAASVALDYVNVGISSAEGAAESRTEQRLQAINSESFVTARAFYSATSCCNEIVREPIVNATASGPYTLRSGWSYLAADGRRTTVFGSVFVLATDYRLTPGIADYSLRLQDIAVRR